MKVTKVFVLPPSPVAMPAQLTALLTVMVIEAVVPVPAENSGKSPLTKAPVEAVKVELVAHLEDVVSQVPLVAAEVPLLSHHLFVALALSATKEKNRQQMARIDFDGLEQRVFMAVVLLFKSEGRISHP